MATYIYNANGNPVGFIRGRFIHELNGNAVGQLNGTHVHKLSGAYVGELDHSMVVDKHLGNLGDIGHPGNPGIQAARVLPLTAASSTMDTLMSFKSCCGESTSWTLSKA